MAKVIDVAVVDDDRMLINGLHAWTCGSGELRLTGAFATVDELLSEMTSFPAVVLLDLMLRDGSDPEANVRRLAVAGCRILIVSAWADPDLIAAALAAGARGCVTKDKDLVVLAASDRRGKVAVLPHGGGCRSGGNRQCRRAHDRRQTRSRQGGGRA